MKKILAILMVVTFMSVNALADGGVVIGRDGGVVIGFDGGVVIGIINAITGGVVIG